MRYFLLLRTGRQPKEWETYSVPLPEDKARALHQNRKGMYGPGDLILVKETI